MALSANTVWEVRTAGSDTNGGGFVRGAAGTDFSQANSANSGSSNKSTTNAVAAGTTTITSATANFTAAIVGNIVYFAGGTGSIAATWRQVTAFTNSTTITIDTLIASSTGMTMNIGGAMGSLGNVGALILQSHAVFIKSGTYSITSASTNIPGGCFSSSAALIQIQGYGVSRNDFGTAPVLQASGISTFTILTVSGVGPLLQNLTFNGASLTSSRGLSMTSGATSGLAYLCTGENCTNSALVVATNQAVLHTCQATGCSTAVAISAQNCFQCESYLNSFSGFSGASESIYSFCLAYRNSGTTSDGFAPAGNAILLNCDSYGNGRDGVRAAGTIMVINCIAEANVGYGVNGNSQVARITNLGTYNNGSGATNLTATVGDFSFGLVAASSSFFVSALSGNFALNNTAGAGAAARGAGLPGEFPAGTTTGYIDMGGAQHPDTPTIFVESNTVVIKEGYGTLLY